MNWRIQNYFQINHITQKCFIFMRVFTNTKWHFFLEFFLWAFAVLFFFLCVRVVFFFSWVLDCCVKKCENFCFFFISIPKTIFVLKRWKNLAINKLIRYATDHGQWGNCFFLLAFPFYFSEIIHCILCVNVVKEESFPSILYFCVQNIKKKKNSQYWFIAFTERRCTRKIFDNFPPCLWVSEECRFVLRFRCDFWWFCIQTWYGQDYHEMLLYERDKRNQEIQIHIQNRSIW